MLAFVLRLRLTSVAFIGFGLLSTLGYCQSASSYTDSSSDGTTVQTWTVISGDMTFGGYNHTYYATNILGGTGGTYSEGPTTSAATLRNDQSLVVTPDVDYTWQTEAQAYCDSRPSGAFYDSGSLAQYLAIKVTYGENTRGHQDVANVRHCGMTPNCSNSVTPACGAAGWTVQTTTSYDCLLYTRAVFLAVRPNQISDYTCKGVDFPAGGAGPCDP